MKKKEEVLNTKAISSFSFGNFFISNRYIFGLLLLLVIVSYANSMGNGFVSDDIQPIAKNPAIGDIKFVFSAFMGFIQRLIYFFAFKLGGLNPGYYRFFNILLHLGTTYFVFIILTLLTKRNVAILSAIIFAIHPLLNESVAWISGMPYTLHAFFFLMSLFFYIIYRQKLLNRFLIISYLSFFFSLVSSEKAIPLFLVFFLLEYVFKTLSDNWKRLVPYLALSLIWIGIFAAKISMRTEALETQFYQQKTAQSIFIQVPVAIVNYFKLIVWPDKLVLYHTEMQFSGGTYLLMLLIFILYLGTILYFWRKNRFIFFWLSFFIISLSTTLTPLVVSWIVAERYAYLGSIGIFVVFAIFYCWLVEKSSDANKYILYGIMLLIISAFVTRSIYRNIDWKDEDHLWAATVKVSPSGAPIHNNMGDVYARHGDYQKAAGEFTKATEINPGYADAFHNLANTYQMAGQPDLAEKYYLKALSINPNIWQSYQNLAAIYFDRGDRQKAQGYIQKALAINPSDQGLQNNLKIIQGDIPTQSTNTQP
ncbi:MAG TPA: tetratricopeptide repeat protein [Patescibacteria group bacterium]|nr:tetratricopeptide repeat protein [Patescibacteria group bacterium]